MQMSNLFGAFQNNKTPEMETPSQPQQTPMQQRVVQALEQHKGLLPLHLRAILSPLLSQISGNLSDDLIIEYLQKARAFMDYIETGEGTGDLLEGEALGADQAE